MKIETDYIKRGTLEEFADFYNLTMTITERDQKYITEYGLSRFYASFKKVEIKRGCILKSELGNGDTPEEAIEDYKNRIDGKLIIFDAYGANRREIPVWNFT